jgi:alkylhydroperoxidase family enzyme
MTASMSRFQIHDELTAPAGSAAVLRGALSTGGQLPNFLGVLAGSPVALRAYARFHRSEPGVALHSRAARAAGLGMDEVALARRFDSDDASEAALLALLRGLLQDGRPELHLHEEARELGWSDEQILEAIAAVSLEMFAAMVNVAGEVPVDASADASRNLEAA